MNRLSLFGIVLAAGLLGGCATTGASYTNARAVPYGSGYYVPAQDGEGDYYYDAPSAQTVYVGGMWQFGFGMGFGPGWYGPGSPWWAFGPGGWWGYGPGPWWGHGPGGWWGYPYVPWQGPPAHVPPPGRVVASAPGARPPLNLQPRSPVQMQFRPVMAPPHVAGGMRAPPMRAPRHGFDNQRR